ncbi:hypothetical protein AB1Y20_010953 [Prymnesium parvum]|uniref:ABC transporter domain-containing protein n=1 Tax=Prymnesium parvum TaxID=97485 RepID=A0AB34ITA8_PRYPA|mmetsp:Transcript_24649/g.59462  ORF Transcript_24649/g.59462 Transcript_24649/m.59462 type:complete len:589 (-) Transcript_24649:288-2054(-)
MADVESGTTTDKCTVQWQDLSVTIRRRKFEKVILQPISGAAEPGDVLAIMGPSGSGKTTMLDALAGRLLSSKLQGKVMVNGHVPSQRLRETLISYVPQEDSLMGSFTVRESLRFAIRFHYGYRISKQQMEGLLDGVLEAVGLNNAADTLVGDIFRKGLSGGQKRRLSLGVELVKKPAVLVLDEPTSGLDSASAFGVMDGLVRLAAKGHTVITTIHQPSSEIWTLFDKFLLLSLGRTIYFGQAKNAPQYFGKMGHNVPEYSNPTDFFIGLVNTDFPLYSADVEALAKNYAESEEKKRMLEIVAKVAKQDKFSKRTSASAVEDFVTLSVRNLKNNVRNPGIFWVRFVMYVMLSLMIGLMYLNLGDDFSTSSITSRVSMIFYVAAFLVFMSVAVLPFFIMERAGFLRERCNGAYGVPAAVLSQMVCFFPGVFLIALCCTVCIVPLSGMNNFGVYLACLTSALFTAEAAMCFIGSCVPHYIIGIALGAGQFGFFMLCQGFFIVRDEIPGWFIWGHYMAFHTYTFRAFMRNEFHPIEKFNDPRFGTGDAVLAFYSITTDPDDTIIDLVVICSIGFAYCLAYALVLQFWHTGQR